MCRCLFDDVSLGADAHARVETDPQNRSYDGTGTPRTAIFVLIARALTIIN